MESHDPHRQVGAVITDGSGQVLAVGTNAPPPSLGFTAAESMTSILRDQSWKYYMLEHAERNAIYNAYSEGVELAGSTMYLTLFPCADCARAIVAAGIRRLVLLAATPDPVRDEKWLQHYRYAEEILARGGIAVEFANPDDVSD